MSKLLFGYFVFSVALLSANLLASDNPQQRFLYFDEKDIVKIKTEIGRQNLSLKPYLQELKQFADIYLKSGPWSITDYKSPSISTDPHDYYSESPYWWPNPDDPLGPYIRKDGLRNPDRFMEHKTALNKMYQSSFVLILAGYVFDDPKYISHALKILSHWFIDPSRRMNPNMKYAQAIPNKSPGRGIGIIDTHRFSKLIEAFYILDYSGNWPDDHKEEILEWFKEYLAWLTESKNGIDEKKQGNNHTTWWCTQVAACSRFVGDENLLRMSLDYVKSDVIPFQIENSGSMPLEEKRTRSLSYVTFNLNAYSLFIRNLRWEAPDLWRFENDNGGSVKKAVDYIVPYIQDPQKWQHQQIVNLSEKEPLFLYFAGKDFPNNNYLDMYKKKSFPRTPDQFNSSYDPLLLLINMIAMAN